MKAAGHLVVRIAGERAINTEFSIDTDGLFVRACYGDACCESAHPEFRLMLDELLRTIQRGQGDRRLAPAGD